MTTNSNFNFTNNSIITLELPFSEHIEELRQRIFLVFGIILVVTCFAFIEVKSLVKILELPISNKIFSTFSRRIFYFHNKNFFLYRFTIFKSFYYWSINIIFITRINEKRNESYFTSFVKFINSIWFRISFFVLYFNTSSFKLFFKLQ